MARKTPPAPSPPKPDALAEVKMASRLLLAEFPNPDACPTWLAPVLESLWAAEQALTFGDDPTPPPRGPAAEKANQGGFNGRRR